MHRQYGPIVRIGHEAVTVTDRTSIREIYQNYTFIKASKWYRGIDQFAQGMFTTPHASVHKQRHRQMEPTFSRRSIHEMEGLILEFGSASLATTLARQCTAEAAVSADAYGKAGVEVDMYTVLSHGTLDAITRLAFGRSVGLLGGSKHPITRWFLSFGIMAAIICALPFLNTYKWGFRRMRKDTQDLYNYTHERINEKRAFLDQLAADRATGIEIDEARQAGEKDILANLLRAVDPLSNEKLTDPQLAIESMAILFAGSETVSTTLTLSLMHLFRHPDLYRDLQAAIISAFPLPDLVDAPAPADPLPLTLQLIQNMGITYAAIRERLPIVEAFLNETMRMSPSVAAVLMREVPVGGRVLGGHYLPAGTGVGMSVTAYHHGIEWEDPHLFKPERFLGPDGEKNVAKLLAFSLGPRMCIGKQLAYLEMSVMLVVLLRFFRVETASMADLTQTWVEFIALRPETLTFNCRTWLRPEFVAA
ncbi:hypothetical protein IWQ60_008886 [Tieghemiomyces parasiticus]|uniref:Cytochrome P450 n=1 Tax=Tieghemiomyces parasiticus TaxID=78921 RepID=A0A9W8DM54_9FUNG|nr:hypothetical protein IWQ60_008886 [Tieghemiomyces parasiticus]